MRDLPCANRPLPRPTVGDPGSIREGGSPRELPEEDLLDGAKRVGGEKKGESGLGPKGGKGLAPTGNTEEKATGRPRGGAQADNPGVQTGNEWPAAPCLSCGDTSPKFTTALPRRRLPAAAEGR